MLLSLIVLLYFLFIQFFANNEGKYINKNLQFYVLFLSFVILNILRIYCQSIFPDIPNYKSVFETIKPISFVIKYGYGLEYYSEYNLSVVEVGFRIFISIFKLISNNYNFFLFFISIIELSVFYFFCKKYKINTVNAFPIYIALTYLTFEIGMLRQALAFCCFLYALIYINRIYIYLFFIILGFTFHRSILFCALLFWAHKSIKRGIIYYIFIFSLILYLFKIDLINYFLPFLKIEDTIQGGRINFYMNVNRENNFLGIGFWERLILFILMNLVYSDLLRKNNINENNNLVYNLGISSILLQMIFFSSPTITSRLRYFIVIFPVIFISEYIYSECKSKIKWLYQFLFILYLLMYLDFQATYLKL
jgi:hypothetical protein